MPLWISTTATSAVFRIVSTVEAAVRSIGRHSEGTLELAPVPEHHAGRGEAADGDPHAFALEHAERREGERIAPLGVDVGADIGERGITDRTEQADRRRNRNRGCRA